MFPRLDPKVFKINSDEQLVLDFLQQEKILLVQGTAFNWQQPDHLRIVFLPRVDDLSRALTKLKTFLSSYSQ
jgi:alanine-synthesizing transaminase